MSNPQSIYRYSAASQAQTCAAENGQAAHSDLSSSLDAPYASFMGSASLSIALIGPDEQRLGRVPGDGSP
jgi:hypothetical protein